MMAVVTVTDRSMKVPPGQMVKTRWIPIDLVVLGNRTPLAVGDIDAAKRTILQMGDCGSWPPPNGVWREDGRFEVWDGRHEYVARLIQGQTVIFVGWLAPCS